MEGESSEPGLMGRKRREKGPTFSEALVPFQMISSTTIPNTSRSKASAAMGSPPRERSGLESAIRIKSVSRAGVTPYSACVPYLDLTTKNPNPLMGLRPQTCSSPPAFTVHTRASESVQEESQ